MNKKCRDFERVLEWQEANQVDDCKVPPEFWGEFNLGWAKEVGEIVHPQEDRFDPDIWGEEIDAKVSMKWRLLRFKLAEALK